MLKFLARLFRLSLLAGLAYGAYRLYQAYVNMPAEGILTDKTLAADSTAGNGFDVDLSKLGGHVNPDLLDILVCPLDKGPLEMVDGEWLVNRRNGYRYPIVEGIPVMLIEVGQKYKDQSLIQSA